MTKWLHFHFSLSCIGEGNGNPLQYSCLENPRDGGAWWAAVYGVTQSRTWLTWFSSSSSSIIGNYARILKSIHKHTQMCTTSMWYQRKISSLEQEWLLKEMFRLHQIKSSYFKLLSLLLLLMAVTNNRILHVSSKNTVH